MTGRLEGLLLRAAESLVKTVRYRSWWLFDRLVVLTAPRMPRRRLAVLTRTDQIGDFMLFLDAARGWYEFYRSQGHHVLLVGNAQWAEWAASLRIADEVLSVDGRRFVRDPRYRASILRRLAGAGAAIAVQTRYSREALIDDALVYATRALQRVGFDGEVYNLRPVHKASSDAVYTRLVEPSPEPRMELLRNADLLRALGAHGFRARVPLIDPSIPQPPHDLIRYRYGVLFPGTGKHVRAWPAERFAEIGRRLSEQYGLVIAVLGAPGDARYTAPLAAALGPGAFDLTGRTDLPTLSAILRDARIVVANDTGAAHIAAANGTPVVAVVGGGHPDRFMPYTVEADDGRPAPRVARHRIECYGCEWRCHREVARSGAVPCIDAVEVDDVWTEVAAILGPTQSRRDTKAPALVERG